MPPSGLFEDTDYPADDTSVYKSVDKPEPERLGINHQWLRPSEFCEASVARLWSLGRLRCAGEAACSLQSACPATSYRAQLLAERVQPFSAHSF